MHCYASIDKKCFVSRAFCLLTIVFMSLLFASSAHAYTINISTEETISIDTSTSGGATIHDSYVDVVTDCRAGYTLTMSGDSNDTTLYLGGDSSYSTDATGHISPVDGTSTLSSSSNTNKWG